MKVKALKAFTDLKEGKERRAGETFEVTEARYKEITDKLTGWLEKVEEPKKAAKKKSATKK
jgi:hypothetical protein